MSNSATQNVVFTPQQQEVVAPNVGILDIKRLSDDTLMEVVRGIDVWHYRNLRTSCQRFKNICDMILMERFQELGVLTLNAFDDRKINIGGLKAIRECTSDYIKFGFASQFCGCMIPFLKGDLTSTMFSDLSYKSSKFLTHFLNTIDEQCKDKHKLNMLYIMSFVRLLKCFKGFALLPNAQLDPLTLTAEISGMWIRIANCCDNSSFQVAIAQLLSNEINTSQNVYVWNKSAGGGIGRSFKNSKTIIEFNMEGSTDFMEFFDIILQNDMKKIHHLITGYFSLLITVTSKEAPKWNHPRQFTMQIESNEYTDSIRILTTRLT